MMIANGHGRDVQLNSGKFLSLAVIIHAYFV